MAIDAFTAGVKPGGLTSVTEIRILLCYLVKCSQPVTRDILTDALMQEQLVNYFEISGCLDDLLAQGLIRLDNYKYTITEKGCIVVDNLAEDLPKSVRESAIRAVLRIQAWNRKSAEHLAECKAVSDGYEVICRIQDRGTDLFVLTVSMPDKLTAEKARDRFIEDGGEIYSLFVQKLIQNK